MDASIIEFLRTGRLGNIAISDTLDKVIYDLGEPDDISISRKPIIYKYGSIQFSFSKNTLGNELSTIHFYFQLLLRFLKNQKKFFVTYK